MGIHYKEREIDYDKTLDGMAVGECIVIPMSANDISPLRTRVCKFSQKSPGRTFEVHKTLNGASITRTA